MKKVVIIGGGFAGTTVARALEKDFDVTLIDSKNYFEFTPGILRTIVEPQHIRKIQRMHLNYLKHSRFIRGQVKRVTKKDVFVGRRIIPFDYLAICLGSRYNRPIKEQTAVVATRASHLRRHYQRLCKARRVLIVGGGLVGVELAAEIITHYPDKKVTIIHAHDRLMERNHENSIQHADMFLRKKGVTIIYNELVENYNKGLFRTDKGRRVAADIAFLCTGIIPNFESLKSSMKKNLNEKNHIKVNNYLQVLGCKNVFAAGDINDRAAEKTAQNAEIQARTVVNNIKALEKQGVLREYQADKTPLVISLGKYNGIFEYKNIVITGIIPAFMKWFIEKREMWKRSTLFF